MSQLKVRTVSPKELNQWIAKEFNSHFHTIYHNCQKESDDLSYFYYVSTSNNKSIEDYVHKNIISYKKIN